VGRSSGAASKPPGRGVYINIIYHIKVILSLATLHRRVAARRRGCAIDRRVARPSQVSPAAARAASSAATRRAILGAAASILAVRDEEELSIREVCARAGVTAPTIYHHFVDRQTLIDRVVDDCFASFDRWLVGRPAPADPVSALHWGFDRYVEFGIAHPTEYRLLFGRRRVRPTAQGLAAFERLRQGMREVAAAGHLGLGVDEATLAYWSAVHGVTALAVLGLIPPGSPVIRFAREAIVARITRPQRTATSGKGAPTRASPAKRSRAKAPRARREARPSRLR
jgi:AcrR family transcriptional regulator